MFDEWHSEIIEYSCSDALQQETRRLPPWLQLQTLFHSTAVMKSVVFDGSLASESKGVVVCLELLTFQIYRFYASLEQPNFSSSFPLLQSQTIYVPHSEEASQTPEESSRKRAICSLPRRQISREHLLCS